MRRKGCDIYGYPLYEPEERDLITEAVNIGVAFQEVH